MQNLILSQFRSDQDADGVLAVTLKAQGTGFEMQIEANRAPSHNDWLREKLARSASDTRVRVSHEQVMTDAQAIIDQKRQVHAKTAA